MENKIHLWIGSNFLSDIEYMKYFQLDYEHEDIESPEYIACQFCKDLNILWYDEDFIGVLPRFDKNVELPLLLENAVGEDVFPIIIDKCNLLEITEANALFWYQDPELKIVNPKESYNGLKYIGEFEGD